jgi:hypothetical protein
MVSPKSLLAISAILALASCNATNHLDHQNRQVEIISVLPNASLSLTTGDNPSYTVGVQVPLDGRTLPIDSNGMTWGFVSVDTGVCVIGLADGTSVVLGGVNERNSNIVPAKAAVGATCQ